MKHYRPDYVETIDKAYELMKQGANSNRTATLLKVNERVVSEWFSKFKESKRFRSADQIFVSDEEAEVYNAIYKSVRPTDSWGQYCPVCNKIFYPTEEWVYLVDKTVKRKLCSYHCMKSAQSIVSRVRAKNNGGGWIIVNG